MVGQWSVLLLTLLLMRQRRLLYMSWQRLRCREYGRCRRWQRKLLNRALYRLRRRRVILLRVVLEWGRGRVHESWTCAVLIARRLKRRVRS